MDFWVWFEVDRSSTDILFQYMISIDWIFLEFAENYQMSEQILRNEVITY